ncbi:hypothetical protein MTR67_031479 [Solanum verrucosum]|uniref:Uncharacterized protein n=1 Tax=Solanum verrucosum TaxID=315347 RepID=A0AAF0U2Q0_SOLVR|nr:hypothetical protein MTR67_031479 [Solanum verrucosum]
MIKSTHFLLVKTFYSVDDYARLYIWELKDGQAEWTIHTLEDMMRACVIDLNSNWDDHLSLIEFAYNNSYHSNIHMDLYEAVYGSICRSLIG